MGAGGDTCPHPLASHPMNTNPEGNPEMNTHDDDGLFDADLFAALTNATPAPMAKGLPARHRIDGLGGDHVLAASSAIDPAVMINAATAWGSDPDAMRTLLQSALDANAEPLYAHQQAAILYGWHSIEAHGGVLFGHDMGVGETRMFLTLASLILAQRQGYAILIGPPVGKGGYQSEIARCFPGLRFAHLEGRKVYALPEADVYFISDDTLTMRAWLTNGQDAEGHIIPNRFVRDASVLVRDEIHRDKGNGTKPTGRCATMLACTKALHDAGTPVIGV